MRSPSADEQGKDQVKARAPWGPADLQGGPALLGSTHPRTRVHMDQEPCRLSILPTVHIPVPVLQMSEPVIVMTLTRLQTRIPHFCLSKDLRES